MKTLLHVGCGTQYFKGFINSDYRMEWKGNSLKLDKVMPLGGLWPYEDSSVDGIVGMHVFQQLTWRELVIAFQEAHRVLKPGGVLRMGVPLVDMEEYSLDYLLGWNNITLLSFGLLDEVLRARIGFATVIHTPYKQSLIPELAQVDNRRDRGTAYIEAIR